MFRKLGATLIALLLGVGATILVAAPAQAHDNGAELTCAKASVSARNYDRNATIEVVLDGTTIKSGLIGNGYTLNQTLTNTFESQTHSLKVTIRSQDGDRYNLDYEKTVTNCYTGRTPINFTWGTTSSPTCDVAGRYEPDFTSWARGENGSFEGEGFRLFISPQLGAGQSMVPGIEYTLTVQRIGPNGQPGYPYGTEVFINGIKSSGATHKVTLDAATGYQSADPTLPCFHRPEVPVKEDLVVTVWEDTDCDTDMVNGITTTTKYTYTWNEQIKDFDETATPTSEATSRPATYEEIVKCNPLPENYSEEKSRTITEVECGITSAPITTVYLDYSYSRDESGHVVEAVNERTVEGTIEVEAEACPTPQPPLVTAGANVTSAAISAGLLLLAGLGAMMIRRRA